MGASASQDASAELNALFTAPELEELKRAFRKLANPNTHVIDTALGQRLSAGMPWRAIQGKMANADGLVQWSGFLATVASVCKGRKSERAEAIAALYAALDGSETAISREAFQKAMLRPPCVARNSSTSAGRSASAQSGS